MFRLSDVDLSLTDGLLLSLLIPAFLYLAYQVYRPGAGGGRLRQGLLAVRAAALVLLLLLLMDPILAVTVRHQRRPLVAVLVDDSESMRVEDDGRARRETALALLKGEALRELEGRARVARYRFSDVLLPLSGAGADSLGFDGRATDIAAALDVLRERSADEGLVAAVLISDGAHNLGGRPGRAAAELGAPIFAVGVGSSEPPRDVALVSAVADPLGYVGREIAISVGVKASGFEGAQGLLAVEAGGQRVAVAPVALSEGEQKVTFQVRPQRPGRHAYRISVAPQPGERSAENNAVIVSTEVLESRLRVLLVAGSPSADLAYLRRLLEADENLELELAVATRRGEWPYRMQDLLRRPEERDLVILFDLPGSMLSGEPEGRLARFVRAGGAVLVVGGAAALDRAYADSPLSGVLPLAVLPEDSTYREEAFQVALPRQEGAHPILRVTDDPLADRSAWADLPPLLAYNRTPGVRPGAAVLWEHPAEQAGGGRMPLAAVGRAGAGKAMVVAARSFWRFGLMMWGIGRTDAISRAFWSNAVRWLVTREDVARVQAAVDKPVYRSGEPVAFQVRVLDELLQPQAGARVVVVAADSGGVREVALKDEGEGRYQGRMVAGAQGEYRFEVRASKGGVDLGRGEGRFTVGRYSLEYEDVRMNAELLEDLAAQSGGAFVQPDALPRVLADLPLARQPVTVRYRSGLWGQAWPFFALVCLLAAEWTVRRRRGMI